MSDSTDRKQSVIGNMGNFNIWKKKSHKTKSSHTNSSSASPSEPTPSTVFSNPFAMSSASSMAPSIAPSRSSLESVAESQWEAVNLVKNQVMANYLYQQQANNGWRSNSLKHSEGILLRVNRDMYLTNPPELVDTRLATSLRDLNVQSAMTVYSTVISAYIQSQPDATEMPMLNGLAVQVVPNVEALAKARTYQFAAVIASEAMLVVWDDDAINLLSRAKTVEWEVMQLLWTKDPFRSKTISSSAASTRDPFVFNEKEIPEDSSAASLESAAPKRRPNMLLNTILVSLALFTLIATLGISARELIVELRVDESAKNPYTRFAFFALTPIWMFFGMFFFNVLMNNLAELFGPVSQMKVNSKHYSAHTVPRLTRDLPHVTIQCPVYKENLEEVIVPTIQSIKKAISTYELQGGSANIFINDDGLQLLDEEMRYERMAYYANNNIGWVARPAHDNSADGFKRKGKFKKASNMNFALAISCALEDKLMNMERTEKWTSTDEAEATAWMLEQTLSDTGNVAWADGNIRIGDYILIIDSDTRIPADCLIDAVSELEIDPEVAILQFSSGVMQVVNNYFENGITFFTNLVYSAIRYGVANGDVAPFVGHNAFLRWSAIQDIAYEEDGVTKFWSESHVSEDFDIALRLQIKGYITRLAAWAGEGFKEGVSLTVYDELARWQKYAYGCNELVFHPLRFWLVRGPFTPLFRRFICSDMPIASKVNIIAYIGTYYAIGASWVMTLANYFIIGWYAGYIDKYYISSWKVWLVVILVFNGLGNVSLATLRYRIGERSFLSSLLENFKWLFMLFIFIGGISIHVSEALLAHMFEINMTWGATAKTLEFSNFFIEAPKTLRRFWFSFTFCILLLAGMIIMGAADFIPWSWNITQLEAIIPMSSMVASHLLLPLALNPGLMTFAW